MKILCTGGAGFIGSHLVDSLLEDGHEVHVIDNLSTGRRGNVNPEATFYPLDISVDRGKIIKIFRDFHPQFVFHLAAMARIPECLDKPVKSFDINTSSTLWLLQQAREWGSAFVFSSSSSVYGEPGTYQPIGEFTRLQPMSLYGLHKLASEQLVLMYNAFYGMKTAALRYFNVYGTSRQNPEGAYPNVFAAFGRDAKKGKVTIFGTGEQKRDYVHVFDVVKANMKFLDPYKYHWGEVYNIGTGVPHTVNEIAEHFDAQREYKEARKGDPLYSCAEVSKARTSLGWSAEIPFEKGIDIFLESLKNGEKDGI